MFCGEIRKFINTFQLRIKVPYSVYLVVLSSYRSIPDTVSRTPELRVKRLGNQNKKQGLSVIALKKNSVEVVKSLNFLKGMFHFVFP